MSAYKVILVPNEEDSIQHPKMIEAFLDAGLSCLRMMPDDGHLKGDGIGKLENALDGIRLLIKSDPDLGTDLDRTSFEVGYDSGFDDGSNRASSFSSATPSDSKKAWKKLFNGEFLSNSKNGVP